VDINKEKLEKLNNLEPEINEKVNKAIEDHYKNTIAKNDPTIKENYKKDFPSIVKKIDTLNTISQTFLVIIILGIIIFANIYLIKDLNFFHTPFMSVVMMIPFINWIGLVLPTIIGAVVGAIIAFILCGICFGIKIDSLEKHLDKSISVLMQKSIEIYEEDKKVWKENNGLENNRNVYGLLKSDIKKYFEFLNNIKRKCSSALQSLTDVIPLKYVHNLEALNIFSEYFQDKRVDSLKEAINLYVHEQMLAGEIENRKREKEIQECILNLANLVEKQTKAQQEVNRTAQKLFEVKQEQVKDLEKQLKEEKKKPARLERDGYGDLIITDSSGRRITSVDSASSDGAVWGTDGKKYK